MKEKIIEVAKELFLKIGFKSITMDDIAKELSISKKTLYTHFKNKTELVKESTDYMFGQICDGVDAIVEKNHNAIEELLEIERFVLKYLNDEKNSPSYQLEKHFSDIYHQLKIKKFDIVNQCIHKNINKGIEEGIYRAEIHQDFMARMYFAGITSVKNNDIFPISEFKQTLVMSQFLDYHIRAIATPKGIKTLEQTLKNNN